MDSNVNINTAVYLHMKLNRSEELLKNPMEIIMNMKKVLLSELSNDERIELNGIND